MYKLALNAGHGLNTPGKRCLKSIDEKETREWVLNSRICSKIEQRLAGYSGIEVKRIDDVTGVTDIPISKRATAANSFNADLYLSIHHNAGIGGGTGGGIMTFTYLSVDAKTANLQKKFYDSAISYTGLKGNRSNPLGKQDLGECRMTKMSAILMECGFMDSITDTPLILTEDFANKIADSCIKVIVEVSGATANLVVENNKESLPPNDAQPNAEKDTVSKTLYRVRKSYDNAYSQIGAFTVLNNAINLAKQRHYNVYDLSGKCIWSYNEYILSENIKENEIESEHGTGTENIIDVTIDKNSETSIFKLLKRIFEFLLNSRK